MILSTESLVVEKKSKTPASNGHAHDGDDY
jgi:hypothetical protein